jgi:DNA-binding beta-propeller fold protein YncE
MTTRSWRAAALCLLVLLAVGCTTQAAGHPRAAASSGPVGRQPAVAAPEFVAGVGVVSQAQPACSTKTQAAPSLPASDVTMMAVPGHPYGVSVSPDGRWAMLSMAEGIAVFRLGEPWHAKLAWTLPVPAPALGSAMDPGGRYLLTADESGAAVFSVRAAEQSGSGALLGQLTVPSGFAGLTTQVAVTPDGRYAFASLEDGDAIAVFRLQRALSQGFGEADYVGAIPAQLAPVGLAVSPDGRWLYSTSQNERPGTSVGSLSVISVATAETDPAAAVVARVTAGCSPVRVITSADGDVVWVTARASDAVLAFSASALRTDPAHALLADVRVGESPVGLALVRGGSLIVVADSDRFDVPGASASLAVVDVSDALARRPALLGYLPAGQFPREMATIPGGQALLVTNYDSDQLEVVKLADLP